MRRWRLIVLVLIGLPVLMIVAATGQTKTNFSGQWSLVPSLTTGGGSRGARGGDGRGGGTVSIVSGATVNCGTECTISQDAKVLTISRPANDQGVKPPDVVLNLDGRESTIIQSSPPGEFKADAKWDGGKLMVTRSIVGSLSVTQTMSVEDGKLTVVSLFSNEGAVPLTLTYTKR